MITINNITLEVNGELYTTKEDFDHSILCDMLDMDDLVLVESDE